MPHWNLDGKLVEELRMELDGALRATFGPEDTHQLVTIGRAIALLGSLAWDDFELQGRLEGTRNLLNGCVSRVLAEAKGPGDERRQVDPEVILALTEALDQGFRSR
jgi:hypothetical protein